MNTVGLHHFHKRKRIHQKHEKYPSKDKTKNLMDRIIYIVAIVGPFAVVPQILQIWIDRNAAGVSIYTFSSFIILSTIWLAYGLLHKEKPIIITHILWIIMHISVVTGILLYG
jgi:MtN3 and saliva related transmembrane protein